MSRPELKDNPCLSPEQDQATGKPKRERVAYSETNGWYLIEPSEYAAQIEAAQKNQ